MSVRVYLRTAGGFLLALLVGFLLGSSIQPLRSQPSAQPPAAPPASDVLVERLVREADETGRQMRTDVAALTELMKRVIREVEFGGWYPELNDQGRLLGERIGVDVEVAVAQTLLAVAEKSVVRNGQEEWVVGRIVDFFQASRADVLRYREKGYPLSSIILGYAIAKAAKASPEQVFEMREMGQSWPAIAVALGVKPQELGKALQGMFP
ncbi:MAG: hypothetical protein RMM06_00050 [Armatimonadota bacterium]|nr:hypothetical protein [bacterium]MCS7309277.1 hypothetical protein [Armatimonadota bacterium]MDW8105254.1 hypothetical protein [Armatimonadota bacterium]MDW8289084.1 hypothetical protein [Armatimonadota bacterium]